MKTRRVRFHGWLALLLLVALACGPPSVAAPVGAQYAQPQHSGHGAAIAAARSVVQERLPEYPGLSIAVAINDEIVWAEGFGWADIEQRVPVRPTSRFRVGSVAKPMTASLLGLLYEEGKIDLDAPVQEYVPVFPAKSHAISTRQVAGHLAGIRDYRGNEFLSAVHYDTVTAGLEIFAADPLMFEPGSEYLYSSYGWNLISAIIEGASGADFLAQMQSRVFEPLGMLDTTADQNHLIVPERVRPYERRDDGLLYNAPWVDNSYKWAGGGFLSTATDLVRFGMAHVGPGFLQAATLSEWQTSQRTSDGAETGYGIGWTVGTDASGRRTVGHGGGSVGGTTGLMLLPDDDLVIAVISNMSGAPRFPTQEVVDLFLQ
ncbi:MAG TPA: serine hydrolase domain-containing protein [Acidobacteriota bacterium]|nr:serine hydrolase domain-containing protein [Acidobacteriota bacterium]